VTPALGVVTDREGGGASRESGPPTTVPATSTPPRFAVNAIGIGARLLPDLAALLVHETAACARPRSTPHHADLEPVAEERRATSDARQVSVPWAA
jgi:hypothetical protein